MAATFNLGNALQAGDQIRANTQNREFNSLRMSGERQRQDLAQREFNAEEQQANRQKLLVGIGLLEKDLSIAPDVLNELSRSGILPSEAVPDMLAEAQNSPETFTQKMVQFKNRLMFQSGQAAPTREDRTILQGADKLNRFVDTGEQVFEGVEASTGGSLAGTAERFFNSLTADLTPEQQGQAREIQLGLQARAGLSAEERIATDDELGGSVADQAAREASRTTSAKAEESRLQGLISQGQEVADGLPVLRRSLELLDVVATGGKLREAQLAFAKSLGIETADQGEISANLGKAVLSQLRETFGAQFTEAEGQRLIAIEAGFGKNNNTNRRLLGQAIKIIEAKANRAIKLARSRGDEATAQIIEDAMRLSLTPGQDNDQPSGKAPEGTVITDLQGQSLIKQNGQWVPNG